MIYKDIAIHYHRFWPTSNDAYAFCQCGEVLIRDGQRFRQMTSDERAKFESGAE